MRRFALVSLAVFSPLLSAPALAQSNIDPNHAFAWGENIGWTNWLHDRPNVDDGVIIHDAFLEGFAWGENVGWINLGDGTPGGNCSGRPCYVNADDSDFGVNVSPTGELFGFAWGENVGWINFDGGALASPSNPARIDQINCRLRGYVWGENVGWINLDDATHYVGAFVLTGDLDGDGVVGLSDLAILLANYGCTGGNCPGDVDGDGDVDLTDLSLLLAAYGDSCA